MNTIIPLQAKAEAILWAGHLAISHGLEKVSFESDYKTCVEAVNLTSTCPWSIQYVVFEFVDLMSTLVSWKLNWIRRSANRAPHVYAKWSHHNLAWEPFNYCSGPHSFVSVCNAERYGSLLFSE